MIKAVFYFEGEEVIINEDKTKEVRTNFRPGIYTSIYDNKGQINIKERNLKENFNPHFSSSTTTILKYVDKFTEDKIHDQMKSMGFIHKLGVFLKGIPGAGKSSLINYLCKVLIESKKAIVLRVDSAANIPATVDLASMIREIQDNLLIVVFDEIDEYAEKWESNLKHFTDGHDSVDNCLMFAATNYPERVPNTLLRPSRFKIIEEVLGIEDVDVISEVITPLLEKSGLKWSDSQITLFCNSLKGMTIDEIKTALQDKIMDLELEKVNRSIGFSKKHANNKEGDYGEFKKFIQRYEDEEWGDDDIIDKILTYD